MGKQRKELIIILSIYSISKNTCRLTENQSSAFSKSRGCNREQHNDVTDWHTSFLFKGKRLAPFCCLGEKK